MEFKFSDGVKIGVDGPLRTLHFDDGWYVMGKGFCIPVADETIVEMTASGT